MKIVKFYPEIEFEMVEALKYYESKQMHLRREPGYWGNRV